MKRIGRLVILALMTMTLLGPGLAGTASAQDEADLCAWALDAGVGAKGHGYDVVSLTGGSGSQIVLGYGNTTLSAARATTSSAPGAAGIPWTVAPATTR